ncbi:MAG: tetratricopeptide repeat protein [Dehalococcoidia bacterium]|nr:tetratricopeptide repeat protein [Dehalococcoidia bacterium]
MKYRLISVILLIMFIGLCLIGCNDENTEYVEKVVTPQSPNSTPSNIQTVSPISEEDIHITQGIELLINGQPDEAIVSLTKAIESDPSLASAYEVRAQAYLRKGDGSLALADCNRAIELDPALATAYNKRGFAYEILGNTQAALADFQKVLTLTEDAQVMQMARDAIQRLSAGPSSSQSNTQAMSCNTNSDYNQGLQSLINGQPDEAIAYFTKAIVTDPSLACAYELRAQAYLRKGDGSLALADCNRAIELDPTLATAYNKRGFAYEILGNTQAALADFQKVLTLTEDAQVMQMARDAIQRLSAK